MKRLIIVMGAVMMTACSTTRVGQTEMPKQPQQVQAQAVADAVNIPEWYTQLPEGDGHLYAAGTEVSSDLQLAIDKATFSAKREIAFKLNNEINQKIREAASETSYTRGDNSSKQYERLVIANSNNVNLVGAQRVKAEVRREGNRFRAYVMLRYDPENAIVQAIESVKRRKNTDQRLDDYEKQLRKDKAEIAPESVEPRKPSVEGNLTLLDVDNEDYKRRRDSALQKPGAVIGQTTVR